MITLGEEIDLGPRASAGSGQGSHKEVKAASHLVLLWAGLSPLLADKAQHYSGMKDISTF